jgi:hypothetical protein
MSIKVGSKMLYCKVAGDKSSEEVVEVVAVQSEAEGSGVTIFIPSLKRERDTELSRLSPIVEKKATLDTFFGKPKLELPYGEWLKYEERIAITKASIKVYYRVRSNPNASVDVTAKVLEWFNDKPRHGSSFTCHFGDPFPGQYKELITVFSENGKTIQETFDEQRGNAEPICVMSWITMTGKCHEPPSKISTETHVRADEVLLDNQRLLFNQLNSLKESLKVLSAKKQEPVVDLTYGLVEDLRRLNARLSLVQNTEDEIAELRRLNASLLVNQQVMAKELATTQKDLATTRVEFASALKEMRAMRDEMALMRQFLPSVVAVPVTNPLVGMGTKF